jgi:phytoene/squalene synthetase
MMQLFHNVSAKCSRIATEEYSTSFSSAIKLLHYDLREPIYNIYGFVRFADEIVDTFHDYDKAALLARFKAETYESIDRQLSLNPILHSFQLTVNKYGIDRPLIEAFFKSMEMDLQVQTYDRALYTEYIYGSAEVVGLMCLFVFCEGDKNLFQSLRSPARSLGAAFQKVNFLRDIKADLTGLDRVYFPGCDFNNFTTLQKEKIECEIQSDFDEAYEGIMRLPLKARFGVYVAYKYYSSLFRQIKSLKPSCIMDKRVRVPNYRKVLIIMRAGVKNQLNLI